MSPAITWYEGLSLKRQVKWQLRGEVNVSLAVDPTSRYLSTSCTDGVGHAYGLCKSFSCLFPFLIRFLLMEKESQKSISLVKENERGHLISSIESRILSHAPPELTPRKMINQDQPKVLERRTRSECSLRMVSSQSSTEYQFLEVILDPHQ